MKKTELEEQLEKENKTYFKLIRSSGVSFIYKDGYCLREFFLVDLLTMIAFTKIFII